MYCNDLGAQNKSLLEYITRQSESIMCPDTSLVPRPSCAFQSFVQNIEKRGKAVWNVDKHVYETTPATLAKASCW